MSNDYKNLFTLSKRTTILATIARLLQWDQETYMPEQGATARALQQELIAELIHKGKTSKEFRKALEKLIEIKTGKIKAHELTSLQKSALKRWRYDFLMASKLPISFVKAFTKLRSEAMIAWQKAREQNNFSLFAPLLEKIVFFSRETAELIGYKEHPYDALLEIFEPELKTSEVDKFFKDLKAKLLPLIKKIMEAKQVDTAFLRGNFSTEKQLSFSKTILEKIGFDLKKGRLDLSVHPFMSDLHPQDIRITTRVRKEVFFNCISAVLHEAGHGLYEMGLPAEYFGSPLSEPASLAIHESQSRFWETRIGQSKPFWKYFLPLLKKHFKGKLEKVSLDKFYKGINKVEPSLIRVEADEVTYSLHVILRFELEKMLISNSLSVKDLPDAWHSKMQELLQITPKNDKEGCLQDIHWSMGHFGYFPTYTLGNLYASFFFNAFAKDHPDWETKVAQGEFLFICEWLKDKIHKHGRTFTAKELAKKIGGASLSSAPYIHYLEKKYQEIYGFSHL